MSDRAVTLKLIAVTLLWGSNYVASAYLLREFSPILLGCLRLVITSLLLLSIGFMSKGLVKPNREQWFWIFLIGVTSSLMYQIFYFAGLMNSSAGNAALIIALSPIATTFLARIFLKESITGYKVLGALVALLGVVIIVLIGGKVTGISQGDVFILLAMLNLAVSVLLIRKATSTMNSLDVTIYSTIIGTILMVPATGVEWMTGNLHFSGHTTSWILLIIMALIAQGLAGIWWNQGISRVGASTSAMYMNIPPFVAFVVAYIVLGDPVQITQIAGGILILLGVTLSYRKSARKLVRPEPAIVQANKK